MIINNIISKKGCIKFIFSLDYLLCHSSVVLYTSLGLTNTHPCFTNSVLLELFKFRILYPSLSPKTIGYLNCTPLVAITTPSFIPSSSIFLSTLRKSTKGKLGVVIATSGVQFKYPIVFGDKEG